METTTEVTGICYFCKNDLDKLPVEAKLIYCYENIPPSRVRFEFCSNECLYGHLKRLLTKKN